jgi:hypothetical protein
VGGGVSQAAHQSCGEHEFYKFNEFFQAVNSEEAHNSMNSYLRSGREERNEESTIPFGWSIVDVFYA